MNELLDFKTFKHKVEGLPSEFRTVLDERENNLLDLYLQKEGDITSVAELVGISNMYVVRILKRIHFKAELYTAKKEI